MRSIVIICPVDDCEAAMQAIAELGRDYALTVPLYAETQEPTHYGLHASDTDAFADALQAIEEPTWSAIISIDANGLTGGEHFDAAIADLGLTREAQSE